METTLPNGHHIGSVIGIADRSALQSLLGTWLSRIRICELQRIPSVLRSGDSFLSDQIVNIISTNKCSGFGLCLLPNLGGS